MATDYVPRGGISAQSDLNFPPIPVSPKRWVMKTAKWIVVRAMSCQCAVTSTNPQSIPGSSCGSFCAPNLAASIKKPNQPPARRWLALLHGLCQKPILAHNNCCCCCRCSPHSRRVFLPFITENDVAGNESVLLINHHKIIFISRHQFKQA